MSDKVKKQFKEVVNVFQIIESYVMAQWDLKRQGVSVAAVGMFCQRMGLTNQGYKLMAALLEQSDKIQVIGGPEDAHMIPRAIEAACEVKEN